MAKARRKFSKEFKVEAVKLVAEQGCSVREMAKRLRIGENLLRKRKQSLEGKDSQSFPGNGRRSVADEELRQLRAENKRLKMVNEILGKRRHSSLRSRHEIPICARTSHSLAGMVGLPDSRGVEQWVLRLAEAAKEFSDAAGGAAVGGDPGDSPRE
jgi:transposase